MLNQPQPSVDDNQGHKNTKADAEQTAPTAAASGAKPAQWPKELGGPKGPEPTRYGDWEQKGRCTDF